MVSMTFSAQQLKARARHIGFNIVGLTPAVASPHLAAYLRWVANGMHGKMGYLARPDRQIRRRDLNAILPGARSLVLVGMDYRAQVPPHLLTDPARGRVASYAWNVDYHDVMAPMLADLAGWMRDTYSVAVSHKVYVDTGAILERSHAQQAGMGFIGKNTMLIHPRRGSYFFLGEIITDVVFDRYDTPHRETMCGSCTRCLHACPTDAFPEPYVLDARRCISYHTIENKGYIPHELRGDFGNWVYGCDVCQDVCPWQRFTQTTNHGVYHPTTADAAAPPLIDLLALTDETFRERYRGSPIYRIKRARLVRNACIAAGNWGDPSLSDQLRALLHDASPLVRAHAAWGYLRVKGAAGISDLQDITRHEADVDARADIQRTLSGFIAG